MAKLIVVTGATGQQGSSVVNFLLKEPAGTFKIRATTRNPDSEASRSLTSRGVEVVKTNLDSLKETKAAFEGAWGVFAVTSFYEHGYEAEQLHGKNMVEAAKATGVKHYIWSTVEGKEGGCKAISWRSKGQIEDLVVASGLSYTFIHIPMYYENFWTSFFAPQYDAEKGFYWSVGNLPDPKIFAFSVSDMGGLVVPAFKESEKYNGVRIKTVVEYLSLRDIVGQFSEVSGEKAFLALELTPEQFEASQYADHPAAELMYQSWDYVNKSGPDSGVRDQKQTLSIYPQAKTYKEWLKTSKLVQEQIARLKGTSV